MQSLKKAPLTPVCHEPGTTDSRHAPLGSQASRRRYLRCPAAERRGPNHAFAVDGALPSLLKKHPCKVGGVHPGKGGQVFEIAGRVCEKHTGPMKGVGTMPWLQDSCKHSPSWPSCCLRFLQNWRWQATWENGFGLHLTVTRIPESQEEQQRKRACGSREGQGFIRRVLCEHPVQLMGAGPGNPHIQISDGTVGWYPSQGLPRVPRFPA